MHMRTWIAVGLGLGLGVAACDPEVKRILNPDHCGNQGGNAWCVRKHGDARTYCDFGCNPTPDQDGCVDTQPMPDTCYSPCGGQATILEDASCLGPTSSSSDSGTSTGDATEGTSGSSGTGESSSTTGPMPCVSHDDCEDPDAPFCGTQGECGTCEGTNDPDGECRDADPLHPLCVGGACVACTAASPAVCDEQRLLCDEDTNMCVPCTEHGQCGSGACELAVGTCFPSGMVVHVDQDGGQTFMSVSAAVASVGAGQHGVIVLHEINSGASYQEAVTIDGDKVIALLAAPGEEPTVQGTAGNPGLTVSGAGTVLYVDRLRASQSTGLGLHANDALVWVDRSRIVQNTGGGVLAENGAELTLRNCFVGGDDNTAAVNVDGATARITFSTLGGGTITATGLSCAPADAVEVRSSIIVALGIAATGGVDVACSNADITYTATETFFIGTGNMAVGELPFMTPADWFADYSVGDFHIQNDGVGLFSDVGLWSAGDPLTDIDGAPRPAIDRTPDYAGADVP